MKYSRGKVSILIVYVNDIILTGDDREEIGVLNEKLTREFEVNDLGVMKYCMWMEIARSKEGIVVSQRKYILDLLTKAGMKACKQVYTQANPNQKLGYIKESIPVNKSQYQRLVGMLIYLSHTRPAIVFALSMVSQFMIAHTKNILKLPTAFWKGLSREWSLIKQIEIIG